jgi:hypothetical protein
MLVRTITIACRVTGYRFDFEYDIDATVLELLTDLQSEVPPMGFDPYFDKGSLFVDGQWIIVRSNNSEDSLQKTLIELGVGRNSELVIMNSTDMDGPGNGHLMSVVANVQRQETGERLRLDLQLDSSLQKFMAEVLAKDPTVGFDIDAAIQDPSSTAAVFVNERPIFLHEHHHLSFVHLGIGNELVLAHLTGSNPTFVLATSVSPSSTWGIVHVAHSEHDQTHAVRHAVQRSARFSNLVEVLSQWGAIDISPVRLLRLESESVVVIDGTAHDYRDVYDQSLGELNIHSGSELIFRTRGSEETVPPKNGDEVECTMTLSSTLTDEEVVHLGRQDETVSEIFSQGQFTVALGVDHDSAMQHEGEVILNIDGTLHRYRDVHHRPIGVFAQSVPMWFGLPEMRPERVLRSKCSISVFEITSPPRSGLRRRTEASGLQRREARPGLKGKRTHVGLSNKTKPNRLRRIDPDALEDLDVVRACALNDWNDLPGIARHSTATARYNALRAWLKATASSKRRLRTAIPARFRDKDQETPLGNIPFQNFVFWCTGCSTLPEAAMHVLITAPELEHEDPGPDAVMYLGARCGEPSCNGVLRLWDYKSTPPS